MRDASNERLRLKERVKCSSRRSDNPTMVPGREDAREIVSYIYAGVDLQRPDDPKGSGAREQSARKALPVLAIEKLHAMPHYRRPGVQTHQEPKQRQNGRPLAACALMCQPQILPALE